MDHQGEVLRVQDAAQTGESRLKVELLESVVGHSFHGISPGHFSLENSR